MASFQAKIGAKRQRTRENKNYRSVSFLYNAQQKITKKTAKTFKKLKKTISASFQAKIGWKRPRMRENKIYRSILFLPDALQKIPKTQQNNSKNLKVP